ncbi:MAG: hypothetical protein AAGI71_07940 [Bacteroidota bacterium]
MKGCKRIWSRQAALPSSPGARPRALQAPSLAPPALVFTVFIHSWSASDWLDGDRFFALVADE